MPSRRYQKRPVVIEAMPYEGGDVSEELQSFLGESLMDGGVRYGYPGAIGIHTLEGQMWASPGDYIIKGIKGEFYPCKPDIFEMTYEPAEETHDGNDS